MKKENCARCGSPEYEYGYCTQCGLHKDGCKGIIRDASSLSGLDEDIFIEKKLNGIKHGVILDLSNKCTGLQKKINEICAEIKTIEDQGDTVPESYKKIDKLQREKWDNLLVLEDLKSRIEKLLREDVNSK